MNFVCFTVALVVFQGAGSWLLPFENGQPPLGWHDTIAYLILPILLVVSQFVSQKIMTPQTDDPQQQQTQKYLQFLPLLIGSPLGSSFLMPAPCIFLA